jgi:hypothetical protein
MEEKEREMRNSREKCDEITEVLKFEFYVL